MNPKELEIFKKFIKFAKGELGIISLPKFKFTAQPLDGTQGTYDIGKSITIFTKNRHIADVCRTSVHELTHHRQFEKGELKPNEEAQDIGGKIENEANAIAGILIKKFAKMICPEIYEPEGLTEDCKLKHSDITAKDLAIKHSQFIGTMETIFDS